VKLIEAHGDAVNFLLVNIEGNETNFKTFGEKHGIPLKNHFSQKNVPSEYGIKYIPHKVLIGTDGKVVKNYDGINLPKDVPALL